MWFYWFWQCWKLEANLAVLYSNLFSDFLGGGKGGGDMLAFSYRVYKLHFMV